MAASKKFQLLLTHLAKISLGHTDMNLGVNKVMYNPGKNTEITVQLGKYDLYNIKQKSALLTRRNQFLYFLKSIFYFLSADKISKKLGFLHQSTTIAIS